MAYTIGNAMIYTGEDLIENGYVTFDKKILSLGRMENFSGRVDRDIKGKLIIPAFVNAHTHIYSALARGMTIEFHPLSFMQILEQLWWRLDRKLGPQEIEASAYIAAADFIHAGVGTIFDHHSSQNFVKGSLSILKSVIVDRSHMRGIFCHETSDRDGTQLESVEENANFYEKNADSKNAAGMMGLHASFTLGDRTLENVSKVCDGKIPIHIHVAEGPEDEIYSINDYGMRIIERLNKYNLLVENSVYAHCIHISSDEAKLIADSGGFIATTAQSNMNNAVGLADLEMIRSNGAKVVIGNDGFGFSPFFDLRMTLLGQKDLKKSPLAFFTSDLRSLVDSSYDLASHHLKENFGRIKKDYVSDLIVIDYIPPTPMNFSNFWDHLFFGITESKVDSLYVDGYPLMVENEIKVFDEAEIRQNVRRVAKLLWDKI